jgi:dienelactone hydrolase
VSRPPTPVVFPPAAVLAIFAMLQTVPAQAEPRFWGDLRAGRHAVGFQTRPLGDGELHLWYPAAASQGEKMRFGEYLRASRDLVGGIGTFRTDLAALRKTLAVAISGDEQGITERQADDILGTAMAAVRDAAPGAERFPMVLWTHRYATTAAQSVLSEYLASHGIVVGYAADAKAPLMPFELKSGEEKEAELARQLARLRAALVATRQLPFVRPGKYAVLAWSYAGESAHALQEADPDVAAVVALSTNTLAGWVYRPGAAAQLSPASIRAPHVVLTEPRDAEQVASQRRLLQGAAAPTFLVSMPKMKHGAFNALEGMIPAVMGITNVRQWSLAGADARLGYEVAAQVARRALAHYLYALPTRDTPFALWRPDGEIPADFVTTEAMGGPWTLPAQPEFTPVEFPSGDGLTVTADLYPAKDKGAPMIVLVHQSGASRGEYRQIAPRLVAMGFHTLAIDNRWGNRDRWNHVENLTARRYGTAEIVASGDRTRIRAIDRIVDLRAGVRWVREQGYSGRLLLWGSSITANGVLTVATEQKDLSAVLAFSPGEYDPDNDRQMQEQVKALTVPVLIACGEDERQLCSTIFAAVPGPDKHLYVAERGRHGSSILYDDPLNWAIVEAFLRRFRN